MRFAAIVAIFLIVGGAPARADFKDLLAKRLSVDPDLIVVNLPPRPDAWPGAIFTWNMRIPIRHGDPHDPALRRGVPVTIDVTQALDTSAGASGGYAGWLGLSAAASDVANVSMSLPSATVVDMALEDLVKRVKASSEAAAAAKRGQAPVIVIKSYESVPRVTLTRKGNASGAAWARLRKELPADLHVQSVSEDSITYAGGQPVVFAFETEQVNFDLKDLEKGQINVTLADLPASLFAIRESAADQLLKAIGGLVAGGLFGQAASDGQTFEPFKW